MHPQQSNQSYPSSTGTVPVGGIVAMGLMGALITGASAAARDIREVKAGTKERSEAVNNVFKEAVGGGLATAAGVAVAKTVFRSGFLALAAMAAVSVGTKYAYDGLVGGKRTASSKSGKHSK